MRRLLALLPLLLATACAGVPVDADDDDDDATGLDAPAWGADTGMAGEPDWQTEDEGDDSWDWEADADDDTEAPPEEVCDNGVDDTGDGLADCADAACGADAACACVVDAAAGTGAILFAGDTTGGEDRYAGSASDGCGANPGSAYGSAPDESVAWTAPDAACYVVHTFGSGFDTVLRQVDGCDGDEITCNDDFDDGVGSTRQSQIIVGGEAGQAYTFVVDGFGADDHGPWQMSITHMDPLADVTTATDMGEAMGTAAATGRIDGSGTPVDHGCTRGVERTSATLRWTAPVTGDVTISTHGSELDTVLSVYPLAGCEELACSDDVATGSVSTSEVEVSVQRGQLYLIAVSSFYGTTGGYVVNID